ncbi:MAG: hypothetical protein EOM91_01565 [Sphingobacteriia bacterium]|nr:hypothetical protein [Sphingobacteriia bacterium]NCC39335.1 hypothetical protein [Gammaproteobacteria bacterium]
MKTIHWGILGALAGVAAVALHLAWPLLYPPLIEVADLDPSCDLHVGPCELRLGDGARVRLAIEPRPITAMTPLNLAVALDGFDTDRVEIDFVGVEMSMGYNRASLAPSGPGVFDGQAILPVCVLARMEWEARVLIQTSEGVRAAPFRFAIMRD